MLCGMKGKFRMKRILTEIKRYSLIIIAATAVLGVLLAAFPDKMLAYTSLFIGGAFIVCGVFAIINYAMKKESSLTLTLGIISAVSGLIICIAYRQIMSVIVFLLGIFLLVGGIIDLLNSFYVAVSKNRSWILTIVLSIASIVLGIVSITNPFDTQTKIVQFLGCGLILFAVLDLIAFIQIKSISKSLAEKMENEKDENGAVEVDYQEVDD